jgi:uncharacterized protein (TIGR02118 family)
MIKIMSMMKRQEGLSIREFRKWVIEQHGEIGKRMPGMRHYKINVVTDDNIDGEYDAVAEMHFDSVEANKAALESPVGAEAGADLMAHCAPDRCRLFTEETVLIP